MKITNISGGLIVGDLITKSFRLNNNETMVVESDEVNNYIGTLENKGLIKVRETEKIRKEN